MRKTQYVEALRSVLNETIRYHGLKWREAERVFGLPKSTLYDFCSGIVPSDRTLRAFASNPVLPERAREYAHVLANWSDYLATGKRLPEIVREDRLE